jgi:tRNA dimethylallyltransferase
MKKIKLLVVAGPTASGKSDIAIRLARRFNGEIISADSRQVYRGLNIGSGKVVRDKVRSKNDEFRSQRKLRHSPLESSYFSSGVRHWMLDVASPKRQYSAGKWKRAAQRAIADIALRGKLPIVCGGTGFWIDALVYDQSLPEVKPEAKLRAKLARLSPVQLYARLRKLDPARAATIDRHNPVRLIRALEIVLTTGRPVEPQKNGRPFNALYLAISVPPTTLKKRIEKRLDARLKHGMVSEVRRLHASGISWKRLESFGLEYRWLAHLLQKKITRTEMRDGLLRDIIAYSKRQLTWWRRNPDIVWVNAELDTNEMIRYFLSS